MSKISEETTDLVKKFVGAPFGSQIVRFSTKGIHPDLAKTAMPSPDDNIQEDRAKHKQVLSYMEVMMGQQLPDQTKQTEEGTAKTKKIGMPELTGKRLAQRRKQILKELRSQQKKKVPGIDWKKSQDLERWARIPYVLNYDQYQKDKMRKARMGPGRYYHHDVSHLSKHYKIPGIMAAKVPRFFVPTKLANTTPGPGTYGEGGIPSLNGTRGKKLFGKRTCMQACCGHLTLASQDKSGGSGLGPATYQRTKGPLDQYLSKTVGIRGPYDTFTGDKLALIKVGHLAAKEPTDFMPYNPPSILQEQMANKYRGKFLLSNHSSRPTGRTIIEDRSNSWATQLSAAGPGYHDPKIITQTVYHKPVPFNSSTLRFNPLYVRKYTGNYHLCGPGRYNLEKKVKSFSKVKEPFKITVKQKNPIVNVKPTNLEVGDYKQLQLLLD